MKTIVALYDQATAAHEVRQDLIDLGIDRQSINLVDDQQEGRYSSNSQESGLVATLTKSGVPGVQAGYFAEGVRRGGTLISVEADDEDADEVVQVMNRHGAIDINERATSWRQTGWTGLEADRDVTTSVTQTSSTTPQASQIRSDRGDEATFEVVEEELRVGKREVDRGGVRVHTHVEEVPVEEQVHLREESVHVERRPVDRAATAADLQAFKEGSFEVTASAEEAVVDKQARVVEEVVINKDVQERVETVRDTLRRTDVEVEQVAQTSGNLTHGSTDFRTHWQTNFANSGYTYEQYEPAYRYGSTLAADSRYQGRDWASVEADARRSWSQQYNDSPWENFKDAVRHGWQQVKQSVRG